MPLNDGGWVTAGATRRPAPTPDPSLAAPADLWAVPVDVSVSLTWLLPDGNAQSGIVLERAPDNNNFLPPTTGWASVGAVGQYAKTWNDTGLAPQTRYWYRISALYAGNKVSSPVVIGPVETPAPGLTVRAPQSVAAAPAGTKSVLVTWQPPIGGGQAGYTVSRAASVGGYPGTFVVVSAALTPATAEYFDNSAAPDTEYFYRVVAVQSTALGAPSLDTRVRTPAAARNTLSYLISDPSFLTSLRAKAAANTAQWQAFKATLDANLSQIVRTTYQGDALIKVCNYALGYQILKDTHPQTAAKYADKTLGLIRYGLFGSQMRGYGYLKYAGRGDGQTAAFQVPDPAFDPSSLRISLVNVRTVPVTRGKIVPVTKGAPNGQDGVSGGIPPQNQLAFFKITLTNDPAAPAAYRPGVDYNVTQWMIDWSPAGSEPAPGTVYYLQLDSGQDSVNGLTWSGFANFLKVSKTPDGTPDYTNWRYNPDYPEDCLDWNVPGDSKPVFGATFYLTFAEIGGAGNWDGMAYTRRGTTITLRTPPAANQAVYFGYTYGSSPACRQTYDGKGGYATGGINGGYTCRYLQFLFLSADWIWDYPLFDADLKARLLLLGRRWFYAAKPGPWNNEIGLFRYALMGSNYGTGEVAFLTALAIVARGRDPVTSDLAASEVLSSYTGSKSYQVPALLAGEWKGGFWPEGIYYGWFAIQNLLLSAIALETEGLYDATSLKAWASDALMAYAHQWYGTTRSGVGQSCDLGDWTGNPTWPWALIDKQHMSLLTYCASDPAMKSYGNDYLQNAPNVAYPIDFPANWLELLFTDPTAPAASISSTPLHWFAQGYGMAFARKDWQRSAGSTFVAFHSSNPVDADHQPVAQGELLIYRGPDPLLINACAAVSLANGDQDKARLGNLVMIDDGGSGLVDPMFRYSQQTKRMPGLPCTIDFEGTADYVYGGMNYQPSVFHSFSGTSPVSELYRSVIYLRSADLVIVHDRVTTTQPQFLKQLQWHFLDSYRPVVSGNGWSVTRGSSRLFGQTFSDSTLRTSTTHLLNPNGAPGFNYESETGTLLANPAGDKVVRIKTNPLASQKSIRYTTALQIAPSTQAAPAASAFIAGDGNLEGVLVGDVAALFGRDGPVAAGATYRITGVSGRTITHYVCNLTPGKQYAVTVDGVALPAVTASARGLVTFQTTAKGAEQVVAIA